MAQISAVMSPKKPPRFKLKLPGSPEFKKRVKTVANTGTPVKQDGKKVLAKTLT